MKVNLNNVPILQVIFIFFSLVVISCGNQNTKNQLSENSIYLDSTCRYLYYENIDSQEVNKSADGLIDIESFKAEFDTILLDNEIYYVVEGDLLLNEDDMKIYFHKINEPNENGKLVGIRINGEIIKISNPTDLKFAIIKKSFSESEYLNVVEYMKDATEGWSKICNVSFKHIVELDTLLNNSDNPDELTFVVKKITNQNNGLLASAFFPYYEKKRHKILITPRFFTTTFNKTGILRHEIGHILGFRHEHIRSDAPPLCPKNEGNLDNVIDLTHYDPQSVMHYFCGGVGSRELEFTKIDSIGASMVYK